jgi:hypothetical protein
MQKFILVPEIGCKDEVRVEFNKTDLGERVLRSMWDGSIIDVSLAREKIPHLVRTTLEDEYPRGGKVTFNHVDRIVCRLLESFGYHEARNAYEEHYAYRKNTVISS